MADKNVGISIPTATLRDRRLSRAASGLRRRKNPKLTGSGQSEAIREQQVGQGIAITILYLTN